MFYSVPVYTLRLEDNWSGDSLASELCKGADNSRLAFFSKIYICVEGKLKTIARFYNLPFLY